MVNRRVPSTGNSTLLVQHNRALAVATVASMVLHELDSGEVQNSTHSLLAATLAAYEAGRQQ